MRRPALALPEGARPVDRHEDAASAARSLLAGDRMVVTDAYATGANILAALDAALPEEDSFKARRARSQRLRAAALRLLAPIEGHALALVGAEPIGFLAELYPEQRGSWLLPFVSVQELHGAWETYVQGVHLPVLGHAVHPFYGTYYPTRTEHLELFATWLSQHQGLRRSAVDVGTGTGVLARMLSRAGFERVLATDSNPNAVESVRRDLERLPRPGIEAVEADLLGPAEGVDLVLFNPPWTPGPVESLLDRALYYDGNRLFQRFFDQACERVDPDGRVVLLFSNIGELLRPDLPHPIEEELDRGRLRQVRKLRRKVKGDGRRTRERVEVWELARA